MPSINPKFFTDEDFLEYADPHQRQRTRQAKYRPPQKTPEEYLVQDDNRSSFSFTYQAARHEAGWLLGSLGGFYEQQWIRDVLHQVRGGKEANVYLCLGGAHAGADYIAAKVYRPRMLRNLRNDSLYREGRQYLDDQGRPIRDERQARAMRNRTAYGQELMHTSWLAHEYNTLQILHAAGVDVPTPYASAGNAILMGYIGDEQNAAPTLNTVAVDLDQARALYKRVLQNVETMLAHDRIHGDLSAYNILYWNEQITLIDFPQAITCEGNRNAYRIFERDLRRVCEYFTRQGLHTRPVAIAQELWTAYGHHLAPEIDPAWLDADNLQDRKAWDKGYHR